MKLLNLILLQWFFVRLARCTERKIVEFKLREVSIMFDGSISPGGNCKVEIWEWYSLQGWIVPLTGWRNKFVYLNKTPFFIKFTKPQKACN